MSNRPTLLLALALAVLGLTAGVWYLLRDDGSPTPLGIDAASEAQSEGRAGADLLTSESAYRPAREERSANAPSDAERTESFELEGAQWVEVQVALPPGSPPDDSLVVVVISDAATGSEGVSDPGSGSELGPGTSNASNLLAYARSNESVAWSRRKVGPDARVRLPLPAQATVAKLALDGRYLYLDEAPRVELASAPALLVLEPELGAWVTGTCTLPQRAAERGVTEESFAGTLNLSTASFFEGTERFNDRREVELEALEFELRGLRAQTRYLLITGGVQGLAPYADLELVLDPGEHRLYELAFELGALIEGRVTDADGTGIEGVNVRLTGGNRMAFFAGRRQSSQATDAQGHFELRGLQAGTYTVVAQRSGWQAAESDELTLTADEEVRDVQLVLERGASISGEVRWPDGSPAGEARVTVTEAGTSGRNRGKTSGGATTGDSGAFEVTGLGDGPFTVVASLRPETAEDAIPKPPAWRVSRTAVQAGTTGLALVLEEPLAFAGIVRDDTGTPLNEFDAIAAPVGNAPGKPGTVRRRIESEDGTFTLAGVFPGEWRVSAAMDGYSFDMEPVPVVIPSDGRPIELVLSRSATVHGIVLAPGGLPVAGARVVESSGRNDSARIVAPARSGILTDAQGRFTMEQVKVGGHSLVARAENWAPSEALAIDVTPGQVLDTVTLDLRVGGRIVGEVFDATGTPMEGRRVSYGTNPMAMGFDGADGTTTDAAGRFVLEHVPPGTWTLTASPGQDALIDAVAGATDESAMMDLLSELLSTKVEVRDGEEVHVTLGAEPKRPVRVFGQITRSGEPISGARVFAISEGGGFLTGLKMERSDADGVYTLTVDRPGAYVLGVEGGSLGRQIEFVVDVPDVPELEHDLECPLGRIEGTVFLPDGKPATSTPVRLAALGGGFSFSSFDGGQRASTDTDGRYHFEDLWPGTYALRAGGNSEWGSQLVDGVELAANDDVVDGIDFVLVPATRIEGTVRDPAGKPVGGIAIFVRDAQGRLQTRLSRAITDAAGRFQYEGLAPGRITVSARGPGVAAVDSEPFEVAPVDGGEPTQVELVVEPATRLIVTVVDSEGEPLRVQLRVLDGAGRDVSGLFSEAMLEELFTEGISTREHRIGPLPPGKYRVIATTPDGREAQKPVSLKGQAQRKLKIRLRD